MAAVCCASTSRRAMVWRRRRHPLAASRARVARARRLERRPAPGRGAARRAWRRRRRARRARPARLRTRRPLSTSSLVTRPLGPGAAERRRGRCRARPRWRERRARSGAGRRLPARRPRRAPAAAPAVASVRRRSAGASAGAAPARGSPPPIVAEQLVHADRLALRASRSGRSTPSLRRGDLDVDLVGLQLDQDLVLARPLALLFSHRPTVASTIDSPSGGTRISTDMWLSLLRRMAELWIGECGLGRAAPPIARIDRSG